MTHIMYYIIMTSCISSGKWIVPVITGTRPPPTVYYTMNTLPDNGGVIFGGTTINETGVHCVDDLFIFTYSHNINTIVS